MHQQSRDGDGPDKRALKAAVTIWVEANCRDMDARIGLPARQLHAHLLHRRGHHVYIGVLAGLAGALQDDATVVHVHHLPLEGHAGGRGEVELLSHEG